MATSSHALSNSIRIQLDSLEEDIRILSYMICICLYSNLGAISTWLAPHPHLVQALMATERVRRVTATALW